MILKNIRKNYFYTFLANAGLSEAIWMLYLAYRGMSLVEIGLLESIFHITSLLMEVPTGAVADRYGRRTSRVLGRGVALVSTLLMLSATDFLTIAAAFVLSAISYNLESGAGDALVYDSLLQGDKEQDYLKVKGRSELFYQTARGFGLLVGGAVAQTSYELAYLVTAGFHGAALLQALRFEEPRVGREHRDAAETAGFLKGLKGSVSALRRAPHLLAYMLFIEVFSTFYTTQYFYFQNFLKSLGHREGFIGLVLAAAAALGVWGSNSAHRVELTLGRRFVVSRIPLVCLLLFGSVAFLPYEPVWFLLVSFLEGLLFVLFSGYINQLIPSEHRATLLSFESMLFSLLMIVWFPIYGWLAATLGFKAGFQIMFCVAVIGLALTRRHLLRVLDRADMESAIGEEDMHA